MHSKLLKYIESVKNKPLEWGTHDCCMFANNCMIALHGKSFMDEFVGKYSDAEGAKAALKKYGSRTLYHTLVKKFGPAKHVANAKRGDIIFKIDKKHGPALGICWGLHSYFVSDDGLVAIKTAECVRSWAVS